MAFDRQYFAPAGGQSARGKAPQQFTYKMTDTPAQVRVAGYFNEIGNMLELGDSIRYVQVNSVSAPTSVTAIHEFTVVNKAGAVVDVNDGVSQAVTDTD